MHTLGIVKQIGPEGRLDPQVQDFLNGFNAEQAARPNIPFADIPPQKLREGPSITQIHDLVPESVDTEDIYFRNREDVKIALRIYRKDPRHPAAPLMFYHGGCWVFCNLDSHDAICRKLCWETDRTVISVDYRLAPEHKFPKGLNDCYDAACWVDQQRKSLKLNQEGLILCGDSAGGNLAAALSLMATQKGKPHIQAQILFYPITDISSNDRPSYQKYAKDYFFTRETMEACGNHYTHSKNDKQHELASPLLATDLKGMPDTLIQTAEFDILRDEAEAFAEKLHAADVDVECVRYNGMIHAYLAFAGSFERGHQALQDAVNFIKSHS